MMNGGSGTKVEVSATETGTMAMELNFGSLGNGAMDAVTPEKGHCMTGELTLVVTAAGQR